MACKTAAGVEMPSVYMRTLLAQSPADVARAAANLRTPLSAPTRVNKMQNISLSMMAFFLTTCPLVKFSSPCPFLSEEKLPPWLNQEDCLLRKKLSATSPTEGERTASPGQ